MCVCVYTEGERERKCLEEKSSTTETYADVCSRRMLTYADVCSPVMRAQVYIYIHMYIYVHKNIYIYIYITIYIYEWHRITSDACAGSRRVAMALFFPEHTSAYVTYADVF